MKEAPFRHKHWKEIRVRTRAGLSRYEEPRRLVARKPWLVSQFALVVAISERDEGASAEKRADDVCQHAMTVLCMAGEFEDWEPEMMHLLWETMRALLEVLHLPLRQLGGRPHGRRPARGRAA